MAKKVILITGVSSGFGKHTSRMLAGKGHTVYGTLRAEAAPGDIRLLKMDLTDYDSVRNAVREVIRAEGRIDVLVNNAGMHSGGPVETSPDETIKLQMDTNFLGTVRLTREVLPVMRNQGGGTIINFSSIGGLMGLPFQAFYSAGKFAIEGFSEALRMEVSKFNIRVVVINPGDFRTNNSLNRRNYLARGGPEDPYHGQFTRTLEIIEKDEFNGWNPQVLAARVVEIIESRNPRQRYIIASPEQKLAVALKYLLPGKWFRKILEDHYKIK